MHNVFYGVLLPFMIRLFALNAVDLSTLVDLDKEPLSHGGQDYGLVVFRYDDAASFNFVLLEHVSFEVGLIVECLATFLAVKLKVALMHVLHVSFKS